MLTRSLQTHLYNTGLHLKSACDFFRFLSYFVRCGEASSPEMVLRCSLDVSLTLTCSSIGVVCASVCLYSLRRARVHFSQCDICGRRSGCVMRVYVWRRFYGSCERSLARRRRRPPSGSCCRSQSLPTFVSSFAYSKFNDFSSITSRS